MSSFNSLKIIDIHAHIFPEAIAPKVVRTLEDYYHMPWHCKGTADDIFASMEQANVYRAVVFSTPTKPTQVTNINDFLSGVTDERFIRFGSVHPDYENCLGEIDRIKTLGMRGYKFHPDFQGFAIDDDRMLRIYERIGEGYPILIHTGDETSDLSSPKRMARVLDLFPEHTFVAAHMGGYACWDEAMEYLVGRKVYFDTSSTLWKLPPEDMVKMIRAHGVEQILFGTDYPAIHHKDEIQNILNLELTDAEKACILSTNALKLFGLE